MFSTQPVAYSVYLATVASVEVEVLVVNEADRRENQIIVNMPPVNMGGEYKLVLARPLFLLRAAS